ncbi:MAG: hypothetical protein P4L49_11520 [Desulfosporosinus sp.]|nr:hypothetical protein [Desulfosporosinus sp.]
MKVNKKLTWVALVATLLLVITGCSPNQQEIFNAALKTQNAKSMQAHTTMTVQLSGSDFEPTVQKQFDQAALFINNAKLDLNTETNSNEQKTASQSQIDMNLAMQGMNISVPLWVDSDLTGNTPKITEIIKVPAIAKVSLPSQFASKEYMVISPSNMSNAPLGNLDTTELMNFSKTIQAAETNFLMSYAQRFNPLPDALDNGIQSLQTDDGLKPARIYEITLNDAQFKEFIRYTVNNFVQDPEAMNFVKTFMDSILSLTQTPDKAKSLSDFDQAFSTFNSNRTQFLATFNTAMDQLKDVPILGDKGIDLKYAISGGNLVQKSGTIDLKVDLAQINALANSLNGQPNATVDAKGNFNLTFTFQTDISSINSPLSIQIPTVTSDNSFDYMDLMKTAPTPSTQTLHK